MPKINKSFKWNAILVTFNVFLSLGLAFMAYTELRARRWSSIDANLRPYVQQFEHLTGLEVKSNVQIGPFYKLGPKQAGVAYLSLDLKYKSPVYISNQYWSKYELKRRKWLVFHELAHAVAGTEHVELLRPDKCPVHFMHPVLVSLECIELYELEYLKQVRALKALKGSELDYYFKASRGY